MFITFLISGLWHGANWTYVIWGALNGFYMVFSIWTVDIRKFIIYQSGIMRLPKLFKTLQVLSTFTLICFSWIFFRSQNLNDAWYVVTHLFSDITNISTYYSQILALVDFDYFGKTGFLISVLSILFMETVHFIQRHNKMRHLLSKSPIWLRWSFYYGIVLTIMFLGISGKNNFIYFQF